MCNNDWWNDNYRSIDKNLNLEIDKLKNYKLNRWNDYIYQFVTVHNRIDRFSLYNSDWDFSFFLSSFENTFLQTTVVYLHTFETKELRNDLRYLFLPF